MPLRTLSGNGASPGGALKVTMRQTRKRPGDFFTLEVAWVNLTTKNGTGVPANCRLVAGVGKPESPLPGRQFQPEAGAVKTLDKTNSPYNVRQLDYINIPVPPNMSPGKKDVLVTLSIQVGGEWKEVDARLVQDAYEVVTAVPQLKPGGKIYSVAAY